MQLDHHAAMHRQVCIAHAYGCPRSEMDAGKIAQYFRANGWDVVHDFKNAELVIVNACGFDDLSERKSMYLLRYAKKRIRRDARFVICGCLAGMRKDILEKEFGATCISYNDLDDFDNMIQSPHPFRSIPHPNDFDADKASARNCFGPATRAVCKMRNTWPLWPYAIRRPGLKKLFGDSPTHGHKTYDIFIAKGCLGKCSFCAIRRWHGTLESRPMEDILADFRKGLAQGYQYYRFIAGDIGAYGQDRGSNIVELIKEFMRHTEEFEITLTDFNIQWLVKYEDDMIPLLARYQDRIDRLQTPIQSGSSRMLELMNRFHRAEDAGRVLSRIKHECPNIHLETQVLVGFPDESEEDYEKTIELLKSIGFSMITIFRYSDRPGTKAQSMNNKISEAIKLRRIKRLLRTFPKEAHLVA